MANKCYVQQDICAKDSCTCRSCRHIANKINTAINYSKTLNGSVTITVNLVKMPHYVYTCGNRPIAFACVTVNDRQS